MSFSETKKKNAFPNWLPPLTFSSECSCDDLSVFRKLSDLLPHCDDSKVIRKTVNSFVKKYIRLYLALCVSTGRNWCDIFRSVIGCCLISDAYFFFSNRTEYWNIVYDFSFSRCEPKLWFSFRFELETSWRTSLFKKNIIIFNLFLSSICFLVRYRLHIKPTFPRKFSSFCSRRFWKQGFFMLKEKNDLTCL